RLGPARHAGAAACGPQGRVGWGNEQTAAAAAAFPWRPARGRERRASASDHVSAQWGEARTRKRQFWQARSNRAQGDGRKWGADRAGQRPATAECNGTAEPVLRAARGGL